MALEVLDNLLSQDIKRFVFPLIDQLSPRDRTKQLHALFPQPRLDPAARLHETLRLSAARTDAWTKACALYVFGTTRTAEGPILAATGLSDRDSVVRETAQWTLAQFTATITDGPAVAASIT